MFKDGSFTCYLFLSNRFPGILYVVLRHAFDCVDFFFKLFDMGRQRVCQTQLSKTTRCPLPPNAGDAGFLRAFTTPSAG